MWIGFADRLLNMPVAPTWYFTSPEPCGTFGSSSPSNSRKICAYDLPTMLASTLSRPRCDMPITTSLHAVVGRGVEQEREHRDQRLRAFEAEALLPEELRVQEALERLGRVEPGEDLDLVVVVDLGVRALDVLLDPVF